MRFLAACSPLGPAWRALSSLLGCAHIGVLIGNASTVDDQLAQKELGPFEDAMRQAGWIEGKTIQIDYRYGAGDPTKIETAAAELVRLAPDVPLADYAKNPLLRDGTITAIR